MSVHLQAHFRVNYSPSNWIGLLNAIENNDPQISETAQAIIADDLFGLARYGLVNYTLPLRMLSVLSANECESMSYAPWRAVIDNLRPIFGVETVLDEADNLHVIFTIQKTS